jgi:hypothetical protein
MKTKLTLKGNQARKSTILGQRRKNNKKHGDFVFCWFSQQTIGEHIFHFPDQNIVSPQLVTLKYKVLAHVNRESSSLSLSFSLSLFLALSLFRPLSIENFPLAIQTKVGRKKYKGLCKKTCDP